MLNVHSILQKVPVSWIAVLHQEADNLFCLDPERVAGDGFSIDTMFDGLFCELTQKWNF